MNLDVEIQNALEVLRKGGIILYPTDTIWGIGCDATNEKAVERIFQIKKREEKKSLIILVNDERMLNKYVKEVPAIAHELITQSETPLTIIYDEGINLAKNVLADDGSIAVRIPKPAYRNAGTGATAGRDEFCNKLIYKFGKPIVSTSANVSGEKAPQNFKEISSEILSKVDYISNFQLPTSNFQLPSSIIKVKNNGEIKIIRK